MRSERRGCMMQGKTFAGWLARTFPAYRDRLIEDRRFFFKVWPNAPHLKEVQLSFTVHKKLFVSSPQSIALFLLQRHVQFTAVFAEELSLVDRGVSLGCR